MCKPINRQESSHTAAAAAEGGAPGENKPERDKQSETAETNRVRN